MQGFIVGLEGHTVRSFSHDEKLSLSRVHKAGRILHSFAIASASLFPLIIDAGTSSPVSPGVYEFLVS